MTLAKVILILVGVLALVGGGLCVATGLAFSPNLSATLVPLLIAIVGWFLLQWGRTIRRTGESPEKTVTLPDGTDDDP